VKRRERRTRGSSSRQCKPPVRYVTATFFPPTFPSHHPTEPSHHAPETLRVAVLPSDDLHIVQALFLQLREAASANPFRLRALGGPGEKRNHEVVRGRNVARSQHRVKVFVGAVMSEDVSLEVAYDICQWHSAALVSTAPAGPDRMENWLTHEQIHGRLSSQAKRTTTISGPMPRRPQVHH
jgi:hypothetical protein